MGFFLAERDDDWPTDVDNRINYGLSVGKDWGFIHKGDLLVVITGGWREGQAFLALLLLRSFHDFSLFCFDAMFSNVACRGSILAVILFCITL